MRESTCWICAQEKVGGARCKKHGTITRSDVSRAILAAIKIAEQYDKQQAKKGSGDEFTVAKK